MTDVMIDIETLGRKPGCVILSIGAVKFDRLTGELGEEFYEQLSLSDQQANGLHIDIETVKWWMGQSSEAQEVAFNGSAHLPSALSRLKSFCGDSPVWGNGATFDISILEAAWSVTPYNGELFAYNQARDVRTVVDLGRMIGADFKSTSKPELAHDALSDAKWQAVYVAKTIAALTGAPDA